MTAIARRTIIAAAAIALGLSATGAAHAQIPGAVDTGTVVITNSDRLVVRVNPAGASATQITGTIQNTTGDNFRCATPGVLGTEFPGQVTEAEIAAKSMQYYSRNIFTPIGGVELDLEGPVTIDPLAIGSLLDYFPTGSFTKPLGDTRSEFMSIRAAQETARINGHTGDPRVGTATAFDVGRNGTVGWTAPLGTPASGIRTDFDAAAMFYCQNKTGTPVRHYVFAGYETGTAPTI